MRHSSLDLTMQVYTDPTLLDQRAAVDALPRFDGEDERQAGQRATGTDDRTLSSSLSKLGGQTVQALAPAGSDAGESAGSAASAKAMGGATYDASRHPLARPVTNYPQGESNPCLQDENLIS